MNSVLVTLTALGNTLKQISSSNDALSGQISRDDMVRLIANNLAMHNNIAKALSEFNDRELMDWFKNKVEINFSKAPELKTAWSIYVKNLTGKSAREEMTRPLISICKANKAYVDILKSVQSQIKTLYEEKKIDFYGLRMSHVMVLGLLATSTTLADFSHYMFAAMVKTGTGSGSDNIPKYRLQFLVDKASYVAKVVSEINDERGNYTFLKEIDKIKRGHTDIVLRGTGDYDFKEMSRMGFYPPYLLDNILAALSHLNIFQYALDIWADYLLTRYNRQVETREWLQNHVALLRMDLSGMDPHSAEYEKTVSIIQAYDEKITEYDYEIAKFEQRE